MMKTLLLTLLLLSVSIASALATVSLTNLWVDYQATPLGIDQPNPHFSWQMKAQDGGRNYTQQAYQLVVFDAKNQPVWDSKKVSSNQSNGIEYAGSALQPTTRYTWRVTVWDNTGKQSANSSWFETGLMNPAISAWSGAKWIGGGDDDLVFYSHYLSVFTGQFGLQLDKATNATRAAFLLGGNDRRLQNKALNLMDMSNGSDQSYIAFELDISALNGAPDGIAKLNIYRVGYAKEDKTDQPFKSLDIPQSLISKTNQYDKHTVRIECVFGLVVYISLFPSKSP